MSALIDSPLLLHNCGFDYNSLPLFLFLSLSLSLFIYLSLPNVQNLFASADATEIQSATVLSNLITEGELTCNSRGAAGRDRRCGTLPNSGARATC